MYYSEFLPKIFSPAKMAEFGLLTATPYLYDPDIDGSMANEFLIAFRYLI